MAKAIKYLKTGRFTSTDRDLFSVDNRGKMNLPRGIRNNNPANLVKTSIDWQGESDVQLDSNFEVFTNMYYGVRAAAKDIKGDIFADGNNTIRKLIYDYAPPHENNTEAYIQFVQTKSGIDQNEPLKLEQLPNIMHSIFVYENGAEYVTLNEIKDVLKRAKIA